uniref:Calmodulin binding transcription activator 1 n=1 Tax=Sarcophilus harrisii TaxID=9305 RepID=A0A7N4NRU2_SARHA
SSSGCLQGKNNEESFLLELSSKLPLPPLFLYPNFDWKLEGKWIIQQYLPPQKDDHGNSNGSHVKIFLPKKLLECLPKCSSLPKERHRWNTNERS